MFEWAITLGVKLELRDKWSKDDLLKRTLTVFKKIGFEEMTFSCEEYKEGGGHHVHVYYKGPEIYWTNFNRLWGLGYVRNKRIYDKKGWIRYIKKKEESWTFKSRLEREPTIIERMTGLSLEEEMFGEDRKEEGNDDEDNLPSSSDSEGGLPF